MQCSGVAEALLDKRRELMELKETESKHVVGRFRERDIDSLVVLIED